MTEHILNGPEYAPRSGEHPQQLIILLHGVGSNGDDLISLAPFLSAALPDAHFLSPNAPQPCDMAPMGYQWFSLAEYTPEKMLAGAQETAPIVDQYITQQLNRFSMTEDNLALVGFSQGTMMSLHVGLRRKRKIAAVLGYSGALLETTPISNEIVSRPPVCLVHGDADPVVPVTAMEKAEVSLRAANVNVQTHRRPGLIHSIDQEGLDIGKDFLVDNLTR